MMPVAPPPEHLNRPLLDLPEQVCRPFSLDEILSATDNFNESSVIGKGGFGKVYEGVIENEPSIVAIKRLSHESKQGDSEFRTEIEMLSKFRHFHIVSLIGYCYSSTEKILVYQYMVNGSLADHLYKSGKYGSGSALSWVQRLKICLGAARGLDYLHTGTGVIHRDMKSSNILLDKNFAAKVSDFGLSRISPIDQSCTHISTKVKGTWGYMDPEYFLTLRLTKKSDVYSFGVVLFEVLCGRRAVDFSLDEEQWSLAMWAQNCNENGLHHIIDPNLRCEIFPKSLTEFARIANQCLCNESKKRPTMTQVVASLDLALTLQLGCKDSSAFEMEINCTSEADEIIEKVDSTMLQEEMQPFMFSTIDDASVSSYSPYLPPVLEEASSSFSEPADDDPLPAVEGLQISGEPFPGRELQVSGYSINGTTTCNFEWVRCLEDGSAKYIDGATEPSYLVSADDVDTYLAIIVEPMNDRKRKGEVLNVFANVNAKITCDSELQNHIARNLKNGHATYRVTLSMRNIGIWEPATLAIKREGYSIKRSGPSTAIIAEKFSPSTIVTLTCGNPTEFSIIGTGNVQYVLQAQESSPQDISCSRDAIVLTMRLFVKRLGENRKGRKKFFKKLLFPPPWQAADDDPLPALLGLQISGEPFPGWELIANGYSINGTTNCNFKWVRHLTDGSVKYIDGAKQPSYLVCADDVGTYLAVEVQPMDDRKRNGVRLKVFANENRKITCDSELEKHIETNFYNGHATYRVAYRIAYRVALSTRDLEIWEPAILVIEWGGCIIKCSEPSVPTILEELSPSTIVTCGNPNEFSIIGTGDFEHLFRVDGSSQDISCSRDAIVLTMRSFVTRAGENKNRKN